MAAKLRIVVDGVEYVRADSVSAPAQAADAASPVVGTPDAPLYVGKKRPCPHCAHAPMGPTGLAWHLANIHAGK